MKKLFLWPKARNFQGPGLVRDLFGTEVARFQDYKVGARFAGLYNRLADNAEMQKRIRGEA